MKALLSSGSGVALTQNLAFSTECSSTVCGTILASFLQLIKVYPQTDQFVSSLSTSHATPPIFLHS